MESRGHTDITE